MDQNQTQNQHHSYIPSSNSFIQPYLPNGDSDQLSPHSQQDSQQQQSCQFQQHYVQPPNANNQNFHSSQYHNIYSSYPNLFMNAILTDQQIQNPFTDNHIKKGFTLGWQKNSLAIISWIAKFLFALKIRNQTTKFKLIKPKIMNSINDRASDFNYYLIKSLLKEKASSFILLQYKYPSIFNFFEQVQQFLNGSSYVINPLSWLKCIWDIFLLLLLITNIFYLPMKISFTQINEEVIFYNIFYLIPTYQLIFDILISLNTAYYVKGQIHTNRKQIFLFYAKKHFLQDCFNIIPQMISTNSAFLDFGIMFFRIQKVKQCFKNLEECFQLKEKIDAYLDLAKLIFVVLYVAHICACGWNYSIVISNFFNQHQNWLIQYHISAEDWKSTYIISLYWSIITMLTIGYGDITARIYIISITLLTCGVFGYSINAIGNIFTEVQKKETIIGDQMRLVNNYMRKNSITEELQIKIRKYYEYFYQLKQEQQLTTTSFIGQLSENLQKHALIDLYRAKLLRSNFLKQFISKECINSLCFKVQEINCLPDQILFEKNTIADSLIFVLEGKVQSYIKIDQIKEISMKQFAKHSVINEKEFFINQFRQFSLKSIGFSRLFILKYQDFIDVLKLFPKDFEIFTMMRDNLIQNGYLRQLGEVCNICDYDHHFSKCPFTFLLLNKHRVIRQSYKSEKQDRFFKLRKGRVKQKRDLDKLQQDAIEYIINNKYDEDIEQEQFQKLIGIEALQSELDGEQKSEFKSEIHYIKKLSFIQQNSENQDYQQQEDISAKNSSSYKLVEQKKISSKDLVEYGNMIDSPMKVVKVNKLKNVVQLQRQKTKGKKMQSIHHSDQLDQQKIVDHELFLELDKRYDFDNYFRKDNLEAIISCMENKRRPVKRKGILFSNKMINALQRQNKPLHAFLSK